MLVKDESRRCREYHRDCVFFCCKCAGARGPKWIAYFTWRFPPGSSLQISSSRMQILL